RVNDQRGHVEGDRALMRATAVLRESVRGIDIAARYGGEEFAVLLPDTSRLGALVVAERIRQRLEERFARSRPQLTVSGGIAVFPEDASAPADLIVRADAALYAAKAAGKNRILFPPAERRRHGRRLDSGQALVSAGGRSRSASVKNVSEGGLLVTLHEPVAVGNSVSVSIERPGSSAFDLRGEVARVDPVGEGGSVPAFDVAVRFSRSGPALGATR
ncbi:MAG TPA: diguanylate cyclase, partial [Vicinamibacteria bacterium]|nr:diguanylate cyclase [Vicinamibacteria bacterium]